MSGVPGDDQLAVLERIAPVLVDSGDVSGGQQAVDDALDTIIHDEFAKQATAG